MMCRSRFHEGQSPVGGPIVLDLEQEDELYVTFLKMRDLLEEYAPSWYADDVRERAEAIVRHGVK